MSSTRATVELADGTIREFVHETASDGFFWMPALSGTSRFSDASGTITRDFGRVPVCSARTIEQADRIFARLYPVIL